MRVKIKWLTRSDRFLENFVCTRSPITNLTKAFVSATKGKYEKEQRDRMRKEWKNEKCIYKIGGKKCKS